MTLFVCMYVCIQGKYVHMYNKSCLKGYLPFCLEFVALEFLVCTYIQLFELKNSDQSLLQLFFVCFAFFRSLCISRRKQGDQIGLFFAFWVIVYF
jgi:hypothetical protein